MPNNETENIYSTPFTEGTGNPIPASRISYDNTDSGLTATNAQGAIDEIAGKKFKFDTLWSGDASTTSGSVTVSDLSKYDALMIYYNSGNGSGIIPYGFFKSHAIKVNYTDGTNVTSASATYVDDTHVTVGASQGSTFFLIGIKFNA